MNDHLQCYRLNSYQRSAISYWFEYDGSTLKTAEYVSCVRCTLQALCNAPSYLVIEAMHPLTVPESLHDIWQQQTHIDHDW